MEIKKIFIVGAGLMGSGIAQVCAQSGINVVLNDISKEVIDKGLKDIEWSVSKFIEKGKLTEDSRFYPPQLLRRKVKARHLGRKTGKGWYEYNEDGTRKVG